MDKQKTKHRGLKLLVCALVLSLSLVSSSSYARKKGKRSISGTRTEKDGYVIEKRKDGTIIKYKKKNVYDFEGFNVDGLYNKPSGSYISNIKDVKARTIIRIRKDFDEEVIDSARMLK